MYAFDWLIDSDQGGSDIVIMVGRSRYLALFWEEYHTHHYKNYLLFPPSQIVSHSKNLRESNFLKFDQIYMIK